MHPGDPAATPALPIPFTTGFFRRRPTSGPLTIALTVPAQQ